MASRSSRAGASDTRWFSDRCEDGLAGSFHGSFSVAAWLPGRGRSPFHTRLVCGLGGAWILDGLQITVASSVSGELTKSSTLGMTSTQVGLIASVYLAGENATLMITQSFLYNAIFFTYALVLINFYHVPSNKVPIYGLAFSIGNLRGPLVLGPLFDSWGRKQAACLSACLPACLPA
jgi:hypothetical protein